MSQSRGKLIDRLDHVYLTSLEGLGSSYRISGHFTMRSDAEVLFDIIFDGVAFGGNYGGHNVNVNISDEQKSAVKAAIAVVADEEFDQLLAEVQRRLLNNEMTVEYAGIKQVEGDSEIGLP